MTKHNQTKSLGTLADFQSAPEPTPETTDQRVDQLERRLTQAETLLNDVMQQLDRPYRDQPLFDGKPHGNGKPNPVKPKQANPVKPKQVKPQLAKPKTKKAKKAQTPPVPPATEAQTQAHAEAIITFLSRDPEKLWHGSTLRTEIQKNCDLSSDQVALAIKNLRKSRHIVVVRNVEVDGEMLDGALQFVSNPQPQTEKEKKAAKKAAKKAGAVAWARRTTDAFEKLQSLLLSGDRITTTELLAADINFILQERVRESDAYKESGIQSTQLDDGTHEYSLETTD